MQTVASYYNKDLSDLMIDTHTHTYMQYVIYEQLLNQTECVQRTNEGHESSDPQDSVFKAFFPGVLDGSFLIF